MHTIAIIRHDATIANSGVFCIKQHYHIHKQCSGATRFVKFCCVINFNLKSCNIQRNAVTMTNSNKCAFLQIL